MGYDSRLHIVKKYPRRNKKGEVIAALVDCDKVFAEELAVYELRGFPPIRDFFDNAKPTDCYIYEGEDKLFKDCYGKPLTEASITDVIACLKGLRDEDKAYRRVPPLLGLFQGFMETEKEFSEGELVVLHYGH